MKNPRALPALGFRFRLLSSAHFFLPCPEGGVLKLTGGLGALGLKILLVAQGILHV